MPTFGSLIIDCDTGRDDALAIWQALALGLPLAGIVASYGNTSLDHVAHNCAGVLALAGREDIPLFVGMAEPPRLHTAYHTIVKPRQAASGNGLCNLHLPTGDIGIPAPATPAELAGQLVQLAERQGKLDYIITGPATNFAALCDASPAFRDAIGSVTMMGGKFSPLWDEIPGADFNLACDPYALRTIFEHGIAVRFVPVSFTWPIALPLAAVESLRGKSAVAQTSRELMIRHCRHFAPEPIFRFHDPAVINAALAPDGFADMTLDIICEENSPDFARLIETPDGYACQCYRPDTERGDRFLDDILQALGLERA